MSLAEMQSDLIAKLNDEADKKQAWLTAKEKADRARAAYQEQYLKEITRDQ